MDTENEWACCKESSMIVYHRGITTAHCYRGSHATWEQADAQGYFSLTSSYMVIGGNLDGQDADD